MNNHFNDLRKEALKILRDQKKAPDIKSKDINKIMEELSVYQIELELQNDELRKNQDELEILKNDYKDLFDHAPNGYITIDDDFIIHNANTTFLKTLKYSKNDILSSRITKFIFDKDQDILYLSMNKLIKSKQQCSCEARFVDKHGQIIYFRIDGSIQDHSDIANGFIKLTFSDITNEKKYVRDLEFDAKIFENISDAVVAIDKNGSITHFNQSAAVLSGKTIKEVFQSHINDIFQFSNIDNNNDIIDVHSFLIKPAESQKNMIRYRNNRNQEHYLEYSVKDLEIEDKTGHLIVFRDRTEDYLYKSILDLRVDLINYANHHSLKELLIKTLDEVEKITSSKVSFYHFIEDDQETILLQEWSTNTKKYYCNAEGMGLHYHIKEAGIWADCIRQRKSIIHNDYKNNSNKRGLPEGHAELNRELVVPVFRDHKIKAMLGVGNKETNYTDFDVNRLENIADVTWSIVEFIRNNEELLQSKNFLEKIFDTIQDGILILDFDNNIISTNKWLYKFNHDQPLTDYKCFSLLRGNNAICEDCPVVKAKKTRRPHSITITLKDSRNLEYWIEVFAIPIFDEKGETTHILEYFKDITSQKKSEIELLSLNQDLNLAKEKAEENDRLKSAFLGNMSHEIRTPMNGILGFAELLKEPQLEEGEQKQFIEVIERSGHRMLNIINDLIDISKIEANQMEVILTKVDINAQLDDLYEFFIPECRAKGIDLCYNTPQGSKKLVIRSDQHKLFAILTNLIKNSIKHTNDGDISFGYQKKRSDLEFYVIDSGTGIPIENQKNIFERFVQAEHTHVRHYEGAGLGLAISKAYAEMLGGKIWIEFSNEKGTQIKFTIPIQ